VIKADGLAAGKGVAVCLSHREALEFSKSVLFDGIFGAGGSSILVEEFMDGIEVSMFLLSDGVNYQLLPEAKDYKRIFDGDLGPNTGGMGSVSPVWFVDQGFKEKVINRIIDPLFETLKNRGMCYTGFLFIGLMKVGSDPFVIEFNTRLGDPETQTLMARIEGDFVPALLSINDQTLNKFPIPIKSESAATVVICAENYPETPAKGDVITIENNPEKGKIFHAGTSQNGNLLLTNGGRVLAASSSGKTLNEAIESAYLLVDCIRFRGMQYRKDIGQDVIKRA
jgi:phosphoribosylamine--glycine ligase